MQQPLASTDQREAAMRQALELAKQAAQMGEVPVGAVVLSATGELLGQGFNETRTRGEVQAHAEIMAIRAAEKLTGDFRLDGAAICVTLEPCLMCLGAIHQARLRQVVYGAAEPKFGALGSRFDLAGHPAFRKLEFEGGVLADECAQLMSRFFQGLREK